MQYTLNYAISDEMQEVIRLKTWSFQKNIN